mmetsp:Transcript_355/g.1232  ORF Transcript_355/g.1232 Transcript_355/m.1232 type:complete len:236 (-) Transcript_355:110-817(-)
MYPVIATTACPRASSSVLPQACSCTSAVWSRYSYLQAGRDHGAEAPAAAPGRSRRLRVRCGKGAAAIGVRHVSGRVRALGCAAAENSRPQRGSSAPRRVGGAATAAPGRSRKPGRWRALWPAAGRPWLDSQGLRCVHRTCSRGGLLGGLEGVECWHSPHSLAKAAQAARGRVQTAIQTIRRQSAHPRTASQSSSLLDQERSCCCTLKAGSARPASPRAQAEARPSVWVRLGERLH